MIMKNVARLLLVAATLSVAAIMQSVPASAVTRADWQAGRIIDDAIFC